MDQKQRIAELIVRFGKTKDLTDDELRELANGLQNYSEEELSGILEGLMSHPLKDANAINREDVFQNIIQDPRFKGKSTAVRSLTQKSSRKNYIRWAAVLAVFFSIGLILYNIAPKIVNNGNLKEFPILPAKYTASLLLDGGRTIALKEAQGEIFVRNNQIFYKDGTLIPIENLSSTSELKLSTPYGGTYKVTLADGTQVKLNAGSRVVFPLVFSKNLRQVQLEGEAYFDVEKGTAKKWPFEVHTDQQIARVLGTTFNICAYHDQKQYTTTLYTGSLEVLDREHKHVTRLKPHEQVALHDRYTAPVVVPVSDVKESDWTQGMFVFNGQKLSDIMPQLERWYNVEFVFENQAQEEIFNGTIARSENLQDILSLMEMTGTLNFAIHGRQIIVSKDN